MRALTKKILAALFSVSVVVLFCAAAFYATLARADSNPIELKEVYLDYKSFLPGGYDPLITSNGLPDSSLDKELNLVVNSEVYNYLYWNNTIHSMTDQNVYTGKGQFRVVGWSFQFGVHVTSWLDFGYHHFSQHLLDTTYAYDHFPVQDALQIKLYLYRPKGFENTLF